MLNKLCDILFLINLLLVTVQGYASPPPLPPSLPIIAVDTTDKNISTNSNISFFEKFKQFFSKQKMKNISSQHEQEQTKAIHQESQQIDSRELNENEQSEPFIDFGSTILPSVASNYIDSKAEYENSTNLAASYNTQDIQVKQQEFDPSEASEPIDIGNTKFTSATNHEMYKEAVSSNDKETNLTSNIITPNVPSPVISIPTAQDVNYVVPSQQSVQIYKPTNLTSIRNPIPLNHHTDLNKVEKNLESTISNMTTIPTNMVSVPSIQDTIQTTLNITVPTAETHVSVQTSTVMHSNQHSAQPITPISINTPVETSSTVLRATESSVPINNSQEIFVSESESTKKQDWYTPIMPVLVVDPNKSQSKPLALEQKNNNDQIINNQAESHSVSSSNVTIQKQNDKVNNATSESTKEFVKNETQMLFLPDDDIVLGKLTEDATLEQMDMHGYIKLFQKKEEWIANAEKRKLVESFIKYDDDINKNKDIYANLSYYSAVDNAFRAVEKNNLFELRALLDVYPILQAKNSTGETLLTSSIYNGNYYLAKFLVIRGIKTSVLKNDECKYPLDIALAKGNTNIVCMLMKAKGYN
ncbi:ankyrin repeat domain-containing protein [Rickettsia prowazekii]|uniref:ankyrin repeat domain-containing protein n=1 Tax=Rickettsia prowazekii TaxID=782 RepID=UPI0002C671EC|nr:ankyrin repeat domain-containing protein [Rickettsia prowazekii]AGJ02151.1 DNA topoisomerase 4 subunit B [Rickettsia prowazekii str. NMRC Madrid E]